ncbi:unnamed protein product [Trichogramma brassicae]|uniref:Uncharacterized protein n=1 Tax=Trichogramma brassicae TaxID=86971 RepID=A0A6H5I859_9HYME|nr:unnamed protein product [Trichogramma brassicae]
MSPLSCTTFLKKVHVFDFRRLKIQTLDDGFAKLSDVSAKSSSYKSPVSRRDNVQQHNEHIRTFFFSVDMAIRPAPSEDPKVGSTFLVRPISPTTASHSPRSRDLRGKEKPCTSVRCTSGFALEVHLTKDKDGSTVYAQCVRYCGITSRNGALHKTSSMREQKKENDNFPQKKIFPWFGDKKKMFDLYEDSEISTMPVSNISLTCLCNFSRRAAGNL